MLLHLLDDAAWRAALARGAVAPDPAAGFVHLSTPAQVRLPATRLFRGRRDVLLLVLDPDALGVEVRFEAADPPIPGSTMTFPHAYGPVPVSAVRAVVSYLPGPDGTFADPPLPARSEGSPPTP